MSAGPAPQMYVRIQFSPNFPTSGESFRFSLFLQYSVCISWKNLDLIIHEWTYMYNKDQLPIWYFGTHQQFENPIWYKTSSLGQFYLWLTASDCSVRPKMDWFLGGHVERLWAYGLKPLYAHVLQGSYLACHHLIPFVADLALFVVKQPWILTFNRRKCSRCGSWGCCGGSCWCCSRGWNGEAKKTIVHQLLVIILASFHWQPVFW